MASYTPEEWKQEMEANAFACCLLMPEKLFLKEYAEEYQRTRMPTLRRGRKSKEDPEDQLIYNLANTFQVPLFAVVWRIEMLADKIRNPSIKEDENI